jgi:hypothetical protein
MLARKGGHQVTVARGLTAAAVFTAFEIALGLTASPARALAPPADGNYTFNQAGVPPATWKLSALCDQVNGSRFYQDYANPIIQADFCIVNVVSSTESNIQRAEKLQNYSGRARLVNGLWTFQVKQDAGVLCPDGSTAQSTETYAFDDETMTGTHTSLHGDVCGLQPAMTKTPFSLQFVAPLDPPVERYPLYCNNIAMCY